MKKLTLIAIAALAMTFAACGNQDGAKSDAKSDDKTENKTEAQVSYKTYTNEKYGFSVEVPSGMFQKGEMMGEEGTVFSDIDEGVSFNRIDISGSKNYNDEAYTPEKVKQEFEEWIEGKDVVYQECGDNYFTFSLEGQYVNEIYRNVYNGTKVAMVSVCYEPDYEKQLGGEVAKHVLNSIQFK